MSKFILNDDGKLKEVASMEKPIFKHYAWFRFPEDVYTDHLAEYEQHLASLRTYTASPELLATMKVGDVVDERDIRCEQCYNYEDDAHYFTAYPRAKEGTGDEWERFDRTVEAMTGNKFQQHELEALSKLFTLTIKSK